MNFSERLGLAHELDTTRRAIGPTVRLLCQVRLAVLAFALVLALLDSADLPGVLLVALAAPFSLLPALHWDTGRSARARAGTLLAADVAVTAAALLPLEGSPVAGSPLAAVYAATTAALWGLITGPPLALVVTALLALHQLMLASYDDGWRGAAPGVAAALLVVAMTAAGTALGRRLRRADGAATELRTERARQAVLAERQRLARDLHDTVAGDLAGLALATHGLAGRLDREGSPRDTVELARELGDAAEVAHRRTLTALGELRDELGGVAGPVADIASSWTDRTGIPAHVSVGPGVAAVAGPGRARHVHAVVTELLENVRKHADASRVEIVVSVAGQAVEVQLSDDGRGLPRGAPDDEDRRGAAAAPDNSVPQHRGYGIRGIRERAALCGGYAVWEPRAGGGTTVRVLLPAEPGEVA